jgi:hypothetical protein
MNWLFKKKIDHEIKKEYKKKDNTTRFLAN